MLLDIAVVEVQGRTRGAIPGQNFLEKFFFSAADMMFQESDKIHFMENLF